MKKYSEIFNKIINKIALLKDKYPHFSEIEPIKDKISKSSDPFEISFLYSHNMDNVNNPRWKQGLKIPKKILAPTSDDGIYIWIRFMEKENYMGQRVLPPNYIGDVQVTVDILGGNPEIKKKIKSIIKSENLT